MEVEESASLLAAQVLAARVRLTFVRARGRDDSGIRWIERSLRRTLGWLYQIRDPRERGSQGFELRVTPEGDLQVRLGGAVLPVRESYLRSLFAEAGVDPRPGQLIQLDLAIVELVIEEALGALSLEEADRQDARSRLMSALGHLKAMRACTKAEA